MCSSRITPDAPRQRVVFLGDSIGTETGLHVWDGVEDHDEFVRRAMRATGATEG